MGKSKLRYGIKISDNIIKNNNGYLECFNCTIARTGEQMYKGSELSFLQNIDKEEFYKVIRLPEDVFDEQFMSSLENKDLVLYHPKEDVDVNNQNELSKGYMRDIRKGNDESIVLDKEYYDEDGNNTLYADLVVKDKDLINMIEDGTMRELSVGYDAKYLPTDKEDVYRQIPIFANHIALVPKGRAESATIHDNDTITGEKLKHGCKYFYENLPYPFEQGLLKIGITSFEVEYMTAEEYYNKLVYDVKTHTIDEVVPTDMIQIENMVKFVKEENDYSKFDLPYILVNTSGQGHNSQDGRHRVMVADKLGIDKIPIIVFNKTKEAQATRVIDAIPMDELKPKHNEEMMAYFERMIDQVDMKKRYINRNNRMAAIATNWEKYKTYDAIVIKESDSKSIIYKDMSLQEANEISNLLK